MAAAPRSGTMLKVQFKLPSHLVERIDHEVETGIFSTRTEFLRHLVENYFAEEQIKANMNAIMNERIKEGQFDDALKERFKKILSDKL